MPLSYANPAPGRGRVSHHQVMPVMLTFTGEDKDLTLDELVAFVESAKKAGVPGTNPIRAELSTTGKIKQVAAALTDDDR